MFLSHLLETVCSFEFNCNDVLNATEAASLVKNES